MYTILICCVISVIIIFYIKTKKYPRTRHIVLLYDSLVFATPIGLIIGIVFTIVLTFTIPPEKVTKIVSFPIEKIEFDEETKFYYKKNKKLILIDTSVVDVIYSDIEKFEYLCDIPIEDKIINNFVIYTTYRYNHKLYLVK